MVLQVYGVGYFGPILAYLLVALIVGAVFLKLELFGKNKWLVIFLALTIATLFVASASIVKLVQVITPWFAILIVSLVFLLLLMGMGGHKGDGDFSKKMGKFVVFLALAIFIISGVVVFSDTLSPYLPGHSYIGNSFTDWLYSPPVLGGALLLIVAGIAVWILSRTK